MDIKMEYQRKIVAMFFFAWGAVGITNGIMQHDYLNIAKALITLGLAGYLYWSRERPDQLNSIVNGYDQNEPRPQK